MPVYSAVVSQVVNVSQEITFFVYAANEDEIIEALGDSDLTDLDWKDIDSDVSDDYECKKDDIIIDTVSRDIHLAVIRDSDGCLKITNIPPISSDKITEQIIGDLTPKLLFPIRELRHVLWALSNSQDGMQPGDYCIKKLKLWLDAQSETVPVE